MIRTNHEFIREVWGQIKEQPPETTPYISEFYFGNIASLARKAGRYSVGKVKVPVHLCRGVRVDKVVI